MSGERSEQRAGPAGTPGRRRPNRRRGRGQGTGPRERRPARPAWRPYSEEQLAVRRAALPTLAFPPDLPVSARRDDIAAAIRDHQVVVVAGETGSGKTTQLPKICLELGRGITGTIGHTQPRRIAARSVAERIASECDVELGGAIGYQVRFTDHVGPTTLVKVMTDGILLSEIQRDPTLSRYDTIIVDEAHERSLNIDFILGYLRRLLPRRPDLKVIITSATIDSERFAAHFAQRDGVVVPRIGDPGTPAPVIEVNGRTYPVEIRYRPLVPGEEDEEPDDGAPRPPHDALDLDVLDDADLLAGLETDDARVLAALEAATAPDADPASAAGRGRATHTAPTATRRGTRRTPSSGPQQADEELDQPTAICRAVDELTALGPGDVLVFCSGEREIRDAADALASHLGTRYTAPGARNTAPGAVEVLPLYARLSAAEQHRVFAPHPYRRVVLATNVAETSLTVPGIHYVVDTGLARISRYSQRTKVQRLPIEPISQASANQRSGRCGRVADGVAIRLYSRGDFDRRPEFTEPEILRTSLASVVLQMAALGLGRMDAFPFVDPPDTRAIRDGVALLTELGAIEEGQGDDAEDVRLTDVGRQLAQLPIDPRLGRMLVEAGRLGVVREVMVLVAALSVQDVRERPADHQQAADDKHRRFADPTSDFLTLYTLWTYLQDQQKAMGSSAFRRLCRSEFLHYLRVREWQDVHAQLRQLGKGLGLRPEPRADDAPAGVGDVRKPKVDSDAVHRALLAGLLSHLGSWDERRREYAGARGSRFVVFPGSSLARKPPAWIVAAELVETSRLFARTAARIQPEWAEQAGEHLVKRTYSGPFWSAKQGAAMCHEKVLLFGVPIVADRVVPFARVDPAAAREMFLRNALVEGEWRTHHAFVRRNAEVLDEARQIEDRARRRGLLVDDEALVDFFDERVPESVTTARAFDAWWKDARRADPDLLTYTLDLLVPTAHAVDDAGFPRTWTQGDLTLPLTYQFTPGTDADGVTVHVPIAVLNRVRPAGFDWLVPGLLTDLVTATIRALPKQVRVQLVPAPDVAQAVVARLPDWADVAPAPDGAPSFHEAFASAVREVRDVVVPAEALEEADERLPAHLRMTFRVLGERGQELDEGHSLVALQRRLAAQAQSAVRSAVRAALADASRTAAVPAGPVASPETTPTTAESGEQQGRTGGAEVDTVRTWADVPGEAIPAELATTGPAGLDIRGYPALVVEPDPDGGRTRVALRVLADAERARAQHADGVRALLLQEFAIPTARVTSRWTGREALTLASSPYRDTDALVRDVQVAAVAQLTAGTDLTTVRDAASYRRVRADVRDHLEDAVYGVVARVVEALQAHRELDSAVRASTSMALLGTLTQVRDHAASLVYDGFVARTPPESLRHLARYLRADGYRLAKAAENPGRDATLAWEVSELEDALASVRATHLSPDRAARAEAVRWQLEELRVSLFAQQLGTAQPVSAKRIRTALAQV
ncbi:ATP-dependent helicase HrpA [Beutenbergia cavernae DSM 12333]|uniref:ATP-dependent helicase HrpA n=1 Tax=Beutenbergia cavernae (strain ATCC BAA-8 / DSM 12333 / CCUG 43141 / JCM 11478 / NBRC 16432 / NCIMB 13614 / HKI 0122) TaxID=471853 RepID=C5BVQ3_BEUC1|nr:ATP-dependent RNA helicase HrpA [Beutenbergia cavernae]ACQ78493.1 ATP-dependent helicase HrpA [Beutenbergia cavernae DSM 12333]